jgi:hypothetical protein
MSYRMQTSESALAFHGSYSISLRSCLVRPLLATVSAPLS